MTTTLKPSPLPVHNDRFRSVRLRIAVNGVIRQAIHINDAIIWRMDEDQIDIAQYGHNFTSIILSIAEIIKCDVVVVGGDKRHCHLLVNYTG